MNKEERQKRIEELALEIFSSERAREFLRLLKEQMIYQTPVADPTKDERHAYFREGTNMMIRYLSAWGKIDE